MASGEARDQQCFLREDVQAPAVNLVYLSLFTDLIRGRDAIEKYEMPFYNTPDG